MLKLMFLRRKESGYVEAIFPEQCADLDRDYVRRTPVAPAGEGDERVRALEEIKRDVRRVGEESGG